VREGGREGGMEGGRDMICLKANGGGGECVRVCMQEEGVESCSI
jgi:hypothetical protein